MSYVDGYYHESIPDQAEIVLRRSSQIDDQQAIPRAGAPKRYVGCQIAKVMKSMWRYGTMHGRTADGSFSHHNVRHRQGKIARAAGKVPRRGIAFPLLHWLATNRAKSASASDVGKMGTNSQNLTCHIGLCVALCAKQSYQGLQKAGPRAKGRLAAMHSLVICMELSPEMFFQ
jgi:hypothetical protein